MHACQVYGWAVATLLVGSIIAAPFREAQKEKRDVAETQKVADQESQLENLVSLAGEKTKGKNVAVHESHVSHTENINGKEVKTEETEEKVTDTETGKVLADVKQVSETGTDGKGEPKKVTETKVDIPDEGVHEEFVKEDNEETEMEPVDDSEAVRAQIEMSPTRVAEELMETFDFDNFYAALKDLVATGVMSEKEAGLYEEEVISEYQRLMAEQSAMEAALMSEEADPAYYPAYEEPEMKRSDLEPMSEQVPEGMYGGYDGYLPSDLGFDRQQILGEMNGDEESLSNIIDALLNAWWEKDFEGGNERALALVSYLDDIVSRDNNPDDIGQIRDILAEMLANALLDDVSNVENEYKMEEAAQEAAPAPAQAEESSEENSQEETAEEENPEEELKEVAEEAVKTAEHEHTDEAASEENKEETEAKEKTEVKAEEEKH